MTGKRSFDLGDLADGENLIGVAHSATQGVVSGRQIDQRPIMRAGEVLEAVPGVIISQHSGEGKANQYYLRGFNLDHGTDFATTRRRRAGQHADARARARLFGSEFPDPRARRRRAVQQGTVRRGRRRFFDGWCVAHPICRTRSKRRSFAPVSVEKGGVARLPPHRRRIGGGHMLAAIEVGAERRSVVASRRLLASSTACCVTAAATRAMRFRSPAWAMRPTGTRPIRFPRARSTSGAIARFDGIDDTLGGATARYSLSADWQRASASGMTRATAYGLRYRLNLFSNFTYFLDDPVNGDQFEQADRRYVVGGRVTHRTDVADWRSAVASFWSARYPARQHRHDRPVSHRRSRQRLSVTREDAVRQTSAGVFAQHDLQWTPWLRSTLGLRGGSVSVRRRRRQSAQLRPGIRRAGQPEGWRSSSARGSRRSSTSIGATAFIPTMRAARRSRSIRRPACRPIA